MLSCLGRRNTRGEISNSPFFVQNGEITDPPTAVTNTSDDPIADATQPFESTGFDQTGLFCSKCVRNQHLLMKVLGSYLPDSDDPAYPAFEREYPRFRRNMEERYPQVCENCEQRVNNRIRQTGYEAKADHLRRTMERSKISRATQKARRRNWRSILDVAGALGYWTSVAGQLLSDLVGTYELWDGVVGYDHLQIVVTFLSYVRELVSSFGYCSQDLAGIALIVGVLSIWWNPKVHHKVEGLNGRILGLNQYYECQLIVMVARFGVWALLKDPNQLKPSLPPAIHAVMLLFMSIVSIITSHPSCIELTSAGNIVFPETG
jgi:Ima1 N-terminal domain